MSRKSLLGFTYDTRVLFSTDSGCSLHSFDSCLFGGFGSLLCIVMGCGRAGRAVEEGML